MAADERPPFADWYRSCWSRLGAAVCLETGDLGAAEDAVADAMAKAMARWDDGPTSRPDAWVYRVATRAARRRRRTAPAVGREPTTEIDADPDLWAAVARLPRRQRTAVVLRYLCDLTQQGVADEMGVAPGTVAALLHQARTRLRDMEEISR